MPFTSKGSSGSCIDPLLFRRPIRGPVPRLPTCPDLLPVVTTGSRVGVRVAGRNRQHVNGWNTRVWELRNSVDKKIVEFGHFITVGTLHFDLAAKMVVGRNRFGPDHAEMMFAIRAHERIVAWHWELLHRGIVQVGRKGNAVYVCLSQMSMKSLTGPTSLEMSGKRVFDAMETVLELFDS
jgi:hypothetical protein